MNNRSGLLDAETDALDCPVLRKRRPPPPYTLVSIINSSTGHRALKFEEVKERKAVVVVMVVYDADAGEEKGECVYGGRVGGGGGVLFKKVTTTASRPVPSPETNEMCLLRNVRVSILVCYVVGVVGWDHNTS